MISETMSANIEGIVQRAVLFVTNFLCSLLECPQLIEKDEGRIRLAGSGAHLNLGRCTKCNLLHKTRASSCLVHVAEIYHVFSGLDI
jgi:hypothetical protein